MKRLLVKSVALVTVFLMGFSSCVSPALAEATAKVLFMSGDVKVKPAGQDDWVEAYVNMELSGGDTIKTGWRAWVEIVFDENLKNITRIDDRTEIILSEVSPMRLNLMKGEVLSLVEKLDKGSTFEIRTPTAVCGVRGSGMSAKTDGKKKTTVNAFENAAFAKGIRKDGSVIEDNIKVPEGFKTIVTLFEKPTKLLKLTAAEKKFWKFWRKNLAARLAGLIGSGKPGRLKKLIAAINKFKKILDKKYEMLEKRDESKVESRVSGSPSSSSNGYEYRKD